MMLIQKKQLWKMFFLNFLLWNSIKYSTGKYEDDKDKLFELPGISK